MSKNTVESPRHETSSAAYEKEEAERWIRRLGMEEIELGGYFAIGSRSHEEIRQAALPERFDGDRSIYSSNYYLLTAGNVLGLHSLSQDELWFFHQGGPIRLHFFSLDGVYRSVTVGPDWGEGQVLQAVAPHQHWFGAELPGPSSLYSLSGCSLAPGFDPRDSALPTKKQITELKKQFPEQVALLERLILPQ